MPSACPICGKPAAPAKRLHPFCSPRCASIDLGRWFTGSYSIPATPDESAEEDRPEALDPTPDLR